LANGVSRTKRQLEISSDELVNVNITSTLMELYTTVKNTWTADYCEQLPGRSSADEKGASAINIRRRSPFVPFALKNDTGCQLWFTTVIKTTNR